MRTFVGIPIPATGKIKELLEILNSWEGVKAVEPQNVHVTLKCMGNIEEEDVKGINKLLKEALRSCSPFTLSLKGTGFFPHRGNPKVVWIGIDQGRDVLEDMFDRVNRALSSFFSEEKKGFIPHVTVGRVKRKVRTRELVGKVEEFLEEDFGSFNIRKVVFFRSKLTPEGPIYTPLREYTLK